MKDYKTIKSHTLESVMFLPAYDVAHSVCLPSQTPLLSFTARKQWKWRAFKARADLEQLFSENILNSDSAGNKIPLIIYIQLLSITYAYKLVCIYLHPLIRYLQSVRGKTAGNPGEGTLSSGCSKQLSASTEHLSFFFGVTGTRRAHRHPWPQLAYWCRWIWVCLCGGE